MFDRIAADFAKNYFIPNRGIGHEGLVIGVFIICIVIFSIVLVFIA